MCSTGAVPENLPSVAPRNGSLFELQHVPPLYPIQYSDRCTFYYYLLLLLQPFILYLITVREKGHPVTSGGGWVDCEYHRKLGDTQLFYFWVGGYV